MGFCNGICFVVRYFVSILVEDRAGCFALFVFLVCDSSSRCDRFVCSLCLWYFLIIVDIFENTIVMYLNEISQTDTSKSN